MSQRHDLENEGVWSRDELCGGRSSMRVFITGGPGLIGRHLVRRLVERGDPPVTLSRRAGRIPGGPALRGLTVVQGDPSTSGRWEAEIDGSDAVVNLVGHNLF